jgi:hypothetical protein
MEMLKEKKWYYFPMLFLLHPIKATVGGVGSCSSNPKSDLQRQLALYEQHDVR